MSAKSHLFHKQLKKEHGFREKELVARRYAHCARIRPSIPFSHERYEQFGIGTPSTRIARAIALGVTNGENGITVECNVNIENHKARWLVGVGPGGWSGVGPGSWSAQERWAAVQGRTDEYDRAQK